MHPMYTNERVTRELETWNMIANERNEKRLTIRSKPNHTDEIRR